MNRHPTPPVVDTPTLVGVLERRVSERGDAAAYTFLKDGELEGARLTYRELQARARAIAAFLQQTFLQESGAEPGRALLLYPPGLEFIASFLGCLHGGVVAVPAYPPTSGRNRSRFLAVLRDARPALVLTTSSLQTRIESLLRRLPEGEAVRCLATDRVPAELSTEWRDPGLGGEDLAFLQYTSGSTASPKGVMVSHRNLLANEEVICRAFAQTQESVIVSWLPLYHDMGLIGGVLQPLYAGARCVLMSPMAFLQRPRRWLEAISHYRATTSGGPDFAYRHCVRKTPPEERQGLDLSSWEVAFNGSEPVHAETLESFADAFAACGFRRHAFYPCYGLAESTLFVTGDRPAAAPVVETVDAAALEERRVVDAREASPVRHLVGCGYCREDHEVRIVDPERRTSCPPDRVGEIWIRGPSVAGGYWRRREATEETFLARLADGGEDPYLRTGDLGFLRKGKLFVTGRLKDLIILRGRNLYPQDIELSAVRSHPSMAPGSGAAFPVEIDGQEQVVLVQEVERQARASLDEVAAAIRRAVSQDHEVLIHEIVLIRKQTIPRTSSGKIRRGACREAYLSGALKLLGRSRAQEGAGEVDDAELSREGLLAMPPEERAPYLDAALRHKTARALGVSPARVDWQAPLSALGLDSLGGVELSNEIESDLGVVLPFTRWIEGAALAEIGSELLARLSDREEDAAAPVPPSLEPGAEYPLTPGQSALWFLDRLEPGNAAYVIAGAARVRGDLDPATLRRSFATLVERHPCLRTTFDADRRDPVQRVHPSSELRGEWFGEIDARSWSDGELRRRLREEAYRPFDLERGPLFRLRVLAGAGDHRVVLLSVHHIVADLWSLGILLRELRLIYQEGGEPAVPLEPLPFTYRDHVAGQARLLAGPRRGELEAFWDARLAGISPHLALPTDRPRLPAQSYRGAARRRRLPSAPSRGVRALAASGNGTLYMALLAAFQTALGRHSGQDDVLVGSPTAGRVSRDLAGVVGYFVNPVVHRGDLAGDPSFSELLERTRSNVLSAFAHQDYPFPLLVERLLPERDPSRSPIFQAGFNLQGTAAREEEELAGFALGHAGVRMDLGSFELESFPMDEGGSQFDVNLAVAELDGRLVAVMTYNTDLFDGATIQRFLYQFETLLGGVVTDPARPLSHLPLLGAAARHQLVREWNSALLPPGPAASLAHLFAEQAERTPEAIAVVFRGSALTYGGLGRRAYRTAHHLRSLGVGRESLVAISIERSIDMVVAVLGVLAAGATYVPVDPSYPAERQALMMDDSGARVRLSASKSRPPMAATEVELVDLDRDRQAIARRSSSRPQDPPAADHLCYVIYTSGSTGRPKGVMMEHRGLLNVAEMQERTYGVGVGSRVLQFFSLSFDVSMWEMLMAFRVGATLCIVPPESMAPGSPLAHFLAGERITTVTLLPSVLASLPAAELPAIRFVMSAAEACPAEVAERWAPGRLFYDGYGPTEASICSTAVRCRDGSRRPPIGRPHPNTRAYLLDPHLQPAPVGVEGEMCLSGVSLARGYLGRPAPTALRFVPDPLTDAPGSRLYRTGDRVRQLTDGNFDFLGRLDHQVKLRGFRIELGEIEAVLGDHPGVQEAVALVREDRPGDQRLVAYLASAEALAPSELRVWLKGRLPEYMVPNAFVVLEDLPRAPNGKVDRRALPAPETARSATDGFAAAGNPVEEVLAGLWADVLGLAEVGIHDSFFELGGHSLLATQLISRVRQVFEVEIPLGDLFSHPTVAALAKRIAEATQHGRRPAVPPVRPAAERRAGSPLPLSFGQERLWFLDQLEPGTAAYNLPGAMRLAGRLDVPALRWSFHQVVRRHDVLRTSFAAVGGQPRQLVAPELSLPLPAVDLRALPASRRRAEVRRQAQEEAVRPFDLARGPLLRTLLLRLGDREHVLLLTMHHIASDGWSVGVLVREISAFYEAFRRGAAVALAPLDVQYSDFALWQRQWLRGEVLEAHLRYWRERLAGVPGALELPTDRPRPPVQSFRGASGSFAIPAPLAAGLLELGRKRGVTLFMSLLAAFQTLLSRYSGQTDLVVGSPIANRTQRELEGLIGFFVTNLALRCDLSGDPAFAALLGQVRKTTLGAFEHQDVPFEMLVDELEIPRDLSRAPIFQVGFALQNTPMPSLEFSGLELAPLAAEVGAARWDLTLYVSELTGALEATVEYSTALFDRSTIGRLADHFLTLLGGVAADPSARLSRLPLLSAAARHQLVREWNGTRSAPEASSPGTASSLAELFATQAERTPEAVAVVFRERALSYSDLARRARQLARFLRSRGAGPETLIAISIERSIEMVEAVLGVLAAGGAYVPVDPSYPAERQALMLEDSGARLVVTTSKNRGSRTGGPEVVELDGDRDVIAGCGAFPGAGPAAPGQLCYVIYTSGSTGRPKGVMMEHRGLLNVAEMQAGTYGVGVGSRVLQFFSLSFDVSMWEMLMAFRVGATLCIAPPESLLPGLPLSRFLAGERLTAVTLLPSVLASLPAAELPAIRFVMSAAEACPAEVAERWAPGRRFYDGYGPTEASICSTAVRCRDGSRKPPIGRPHPNTQAYLLDPHLRPAPVGLEGEMCLSGVSLARGYLGRPAVTALRFVPDPFHEGPGSRLYRTGDRVRQLVDGNFDFLGRLDHQVKLRGFRIELGEIEAALGDYPGVQEAVALVREDRAGDQRLVAYLVSAETLAPAEMRAWLKDRLPEYMVPNALVVLEDLPRAPNGKVDRRALPAPESTSSEAADLVAPRTPLEEVLAGIWADLLDRRELGVDQSFFDLGGHSLLATRLVARVQESLGVEVPVRWVFESPTIASFAVRVQEAVRAGRKWDVPPLEPVSRDGELPLSFAQERLWFLHQLDLGSPLYNLPAAFRLRGRLSAPALTAALAEIVRRHEVLRTRLVAPGGRPVMTIVPEVSFAVPVVDLEALPAAAREALHRRLIGEQARRPFDLERGEVLRAELLRTARDEHTLSVALHHVASDGWSVGVLLRELAALYEAFSQGRPSPLAELPVQYADYASWQRRWLRDDVLQAHLDFWQGQLGLNPPVLELPTDRPRPPVQTFRGATHSFRLSASTARELRGLGHREAATTFMTLLAGFQALLSRYSGQTDFVVGAAVANRPDVKLEGLIGLFLNMLVLPSDMAGEPSFTRLVRRVRDRTLAAFGFRDLPFERLVDQLDSRRDLSRNPLFQVMFTLQSSPMSSLELSGLAGERLEVAHDTSQFDLTLVTEEEPDGTIVGVFEYSLELFDPTTVERLSRHFRSLLAGLAAEPRRRASEWPMTGAGERHQLIAEWQDTAVAFPRGASIHELFAAQAARTPDAVALVFEGDELPYRELDRRSDALARKLADLGVGPERLVGVMMDRCPEMVVALLGILKAGGAYLPLDPEYPEERLAWIVRDARAEVLVTQTRLAERLPAAGVRRLLVDRGWTPDGPAAGFPASGVTPENLAYAIYTSGSTGWPKGVMVRHRNAVSFFAGMDGALGGEPGTFLALTSISFDISVLELLWTLTRGHRVILQGDKTAAYYRARPAVRSPAARGGMEFSLFYFAADQTHDAGERYRLLLEGAKFADRHGFSAVWTPERHFHPFGGLYPNPSVTGSAVAAVTERIAIRAGSVVLPLHNPIRVAEEWSVVDNISGGRVGISFASGWHANDFALAPESYARRREVMFESIETVRRLWRGESVAVRSGGGGEIEVSIYPSPVQAELPIWITAAGNPATFEEAGTLGASLLTHLLNQTLDELREKIALYRKAWRESAHPGRGHVTLMLHTFVGDDREAACEKARGPFCNYLKSSLGLLRNMAREIGMDMDAPEFGERNLDLLAGAAFERYRNSSALFGTPESCLPLVERFAALGVDEIGCLVDFGVGTEEVLAHLEHLDVLRRRVQGDGQPAAADPTAADPTAADPTAADPTAADYSVAAQIRRHSVTHLQCTPSAAQLLAGDRETREALGSLPRLLLGGEALPAPLAEELAAAGPVALYNMYGPTETTVWSSTHLVARGQNPVPIGRPIANTDLVVLDRGFRPAPVGVPGELAIGGAGVARGYWGRPALTAARFVPHAHARRPGECLYRTGDLARYLRDGTREFMGRIDQQVKVSGYRIEPGEVEARLRRHPAVAEAVVVTREDQPGQPRLVAYVVPEASGERILELGVDAAREAELFAGRQRFRLPNGMSVAHLSDFQTPVGYQEIFVDRVYARHGVTYADDDCIFDVGANIGLFTLFAHCHCRPSRFFAFEPIPATFDVLATNVALYGLDVTLFPYGVSRRREKATFTYYPNMAGLSGRYADLASDRESTRAIILDYMERHPEAFRGTAVTAGDLDGLLDAQFESETHERPLITLSEVIDEHRVERVDLLKIDVERAELDVLHGLRDEHWEKVRQIVIEVDTRENLDGITALLREKGYELAVDDLAVVEAHAGRPEVAVYLLSALRRGAERWAEERRRRPRAERTEAPASRARVTGAELRSFLQQSLPDYMVPAVFVPLAELPLTPNKKVDRRALPAPDSRREERRSEVQFVAPRNEAESAIAALWRQVLNLERIGVNDNFFEVGGNSLLLAELRGKLQGEFEREVAMVEIFRHPTIASLAGFLSQEHEERPSLEKAEERGRKQTDAARTTAALERQRQFALRRRQRPRGLR